MKQIKVGYMTTSILEDMCLELLEDIEFDNGKFRKEKLKDSAYVGLLISYERLKKYNQGEEK